jgi:hypothetical protein
LRRPVKLKLNKSHDPVPSWTSFDWFSEDKPQTMQWFSPEVTLVVSCYSYPHLSTSSFLKGKGTSEKEAVDIPIVF